MQSLYSFFQNEKSDLNKHITFFKESFLNTFSLYITILSFLKSIHEYAQQHILLQKELRNGPLDSKSSHLVSNKILSFISNHRVLTSIIKEKKIKYWELDFEYVKTAFKDLMESESFITYSRLENPTINQDREIIIFFFKEIIAVSEVFYEYMEDHELTWIDDLPVVNTFTLKMLNKIDPSDFNSLNFPEMSPSDEDPKFAVELLEKVVVKNDELKSELEGRTPNWDSDRIAFIDAILIKMATAELLYFPTIPPKVTMNEYIEISKDYSTPKSNIFINGILDKMIKDFNNKGCLNKTGRGLL
jgi:N utilization substance protein B